MNWESFHKFHLCIILKVWKIVMRTYCCALEKDSGEGTVSSCYCFLCENKAQVHLSLHFKARLSAKSVFIFVEIRTYYHNKNFALRLALKERPRGTRKWPIGAGVLSLLLNTL